MDTRHAPSPSLRFTGQIKAYRLPVAPEPPRSPGGQRCLRDLGEAVSRSWRLRRRTKRWLDDHSDTVTSVGVGAIVVAGVVTFLCVASVL